MPGIIRRLLGPQAKLPDAWDDYWYMPVTSETQAGVKVDASTAMKISTVYACVKVLAETLASLPLIVYERLPDGGKKRAMNHPLYDPLHNQPNRWQTSFEWREMKMGHVLLRGNCYSQIIPGPRGFADQLAPLHPAYMEKVERLPTGELRYTYQEPNGPSRIFNGGEIFHVPGLSDNGLGGLSVIALARESMGAAIAAEGYGARFFSQDARPGGVLQHPGKLTKEAHDRISESWKKAHSGLPGAHQAALLEEGMQWKQVGMTSEDAQFLETREFQVEDIARWFRVPLHMIGSTSKVTSWGTGIEQLSLGFVIYSLLPWLRRWEQRISSSLILAPRRYFVEFLVDGLLRGDLKTRYEAYGTAINWGWLSPNDVRRLENMNPREGGEEYLRPTNMMPSQAAAENPHIGMMAREVAGQVVRKEIAAMTRAAKRYADNEQGWQQAIREFYDEHCEHVMGKLHLDEGTATEYVEQQRDALLFGGVQTMTNWEQERVDYLVARMMEAENA